MFNQNQFIVYIFNDIVCKLSCSDIYQFVINFDLLYIRDIYVYVVMNRGAFLVRLCKWYVDLSSSRLYTCSLYKRILSRQDRRVNILALFALLSKRQWPCLVVYLRLGSYVSCGFFGVGGYWNRWPFVLEMFFFFGSSHIDGCLFYIYDDIKCTLGWLCPFVVTYGLKKLVWWGFCETAVKYIGRIVL